LIKLIINNLMIHFINVGPVKKYILLFILIFLKKLKD
jgi:hypothetical protein